MGWTVTAVRARVALAVGAGLLAGLFILGQIVALSTDTVLVALLGLLAVLYGLDRWVG